jgi:cytochrome c oxidase subunit 3
MTASIAQTARDLRQDQRELGLWMFLGTVTMLFAAFASAYIVRRSGNDWHAANLPSILWVNTGVLAVSSVALEMAVHFGRRRRWESARAAFAASFFLGLAFLAGQVSAWQQARAVGIYVSTNPHASFFFILTGAHAVHIVAALTVLAWGLALTLGRSPNPRLWDARIGLCRTFWHYLGGVWIFLFALMSAY